MDSKRCVSPLRSKVFPVVLALFLAVSFTACDQSSQNIQLAPGSSLTVSGPSSLTVPNYDSTTTGEYMVRAFTIDQNYSWSVEGANLKGTKRDGEVAVVSTSTPGDFTVSVSTTIDGESYSGSASGSASYPTAAEQAAKYSLTTFKKAGTSTGLVSQLTTGLTVFAPSNAAFLETFDANGDGTLEGELPPPGVLAAVLRYHAARDSLTTDEIADGDQSVTALHPKEMISFTTNGGTSVEGAESSAAFVSPDIATSEGAVLHKVDGVLLPSSVVSINPQTNDESVTVEGTYVTDGGFIALHADSTDGDIIGSSGYLEESTSNKPAQGFHSGIKIELDSQLSDTTNVVAMPHRDTNGDQTFTFNANTGTDVPYFRGSSSVPVVDSAEVATP